MGVIVNKIFNYMTEIANDCDFWSAYILEEESEEVSFRNGVQNPIHSFLDVGCLITVMKDGGVGYASTPDFSRSGLQAAFEQARWWATTFAENSLLKGVKIPFQANNEICETSKDVSINKISVDERIAMLFEVDRLLSGHSSIIDSSAYLCSIDSRTTYFNSLGSKIIQQAIRFVPCLSATANNGSGTQVRTLGGMRAYCRQGGFQSFKSLNLPMHAERIAKEVVELANAENCPSDIMDALIAPDQMMLQIHESIGHPIELDRILGDERNYAGTSFVTMDMFGTYKYGSSLLNITFDPTISEEFASYEYDDEGLKATKEFVIKDGILLRPLGGAVAQGRAKMPGVANARSSSWNRPPIDRMANLNLEPGSSSLAEMVSSIKKGIYLKSNSSWSIDDSRNKFQFGCEWGQLIENGELTKVVKNPNYKGISANFWQNLAMVGDESTFAVLGTPYCGKGEPNQCIRVGHASPTCLFINVDIFGGE